MAAVIAAIVAAFLAGGVALFREHRLQQRRLLVAARITSSTFGVAAQAIKTALQRDGWALFNSIPSEASFSTVWDTYKGDLAGHLTWSEWNKVETGVNRYLAVRTMSQDELPTDAKDVLNLARDSLVEGGVSLYPYCTYRLSLWKLLRRRLSSRKKARPAQ